MTQYIAVQKRSRLLIGLAGAMRNVTTLLLLGMIAALSIGDLAGGSDAGFALLLAVISVAAGVWVARGALPAGARVLRDLFGTAVLTQGRLAARRTGHGGYGIDYRIRLEGGQEFSVSRKDYERLHVGMKLSVSHYPRTKVVTDVTAE